MKTIVLVLHLSHHRHLQQPHSYTTPNFLVNKPKQRQRRTPQSSFMRVKPLNSNYQTHKGKGGEKNKQGNRGHMRKLHVTRQFFKASGRHEDFFGKTKNPF